MSRRAFMTPWTCPAGRLRTILATVAVIAGMSLAAAQTMPSYVSAVLDAVQDHPAIQAAEAGMTAAERNLAGARQPVELNVEGSYTRYVVVGDNADQVPQPDPEITASLVAHPFLYGDLADREAQRLVELERAQLAVRETKASVEASAIEAAMNVIVARQARDIAHDAFELARMAVDIAEERAARGAAREADVARAQQDLARARAELDRSDRRLELAIASLASWTGPDGIPTLDDTLPTFEPVEGQPPAVTRARLDVELAAVGVGAAERNLLPVAQASYAWILDDDQGTITVALESRTLSPSVAYQTSSPTPPGGSGASASATDLPPFTPLQTAPEAPRTTAGFSIGVSLTLSPERFQAIEAARARVAAANANLEATELRVALERESLLVAVAGAHDDVELARADLALAEADLADVAQRVELGLATDLERRRQQIAVARSQLALVQAHAALAAAQLDIYVHAAIPVSEVWK